jgi:hypothetical protein
MLEPSLYSPLSAMTILNLTSALVRSSEEADRLAAFLPSQYESFSHDMISRLQRNGTAVPYPGDRQQQIS